MRPRLSTLAAAAALAACGGGPPKPAGLAYSLPAVTAVTYMTGDSASMDIDAGGQYFQMDLNRSSTLGTTFTRSADGIQVSVDVKDFSATQSNPMGAPVHADGSGIKGPLVFSLDRRGTPTVVSKPVVGGVASSYFEPVEVATALFPRLPGRAAHPGDTWTDTINYEATPGSSTAKSTSVVTYTVVGDTVAGGHSVIKVAIKATGERSSSGNFAGMDFSQKLTSTSEGWFLWDLQRGLMVEKYVTDDASGSMDVSAAPYPLALRVRTENRIRLTEEM